MKTTIINFKFLLVLFTVALVSSCSQEENVTTEDTSTDLIIEQSSKAAEADVATDGIFNLIEMAYSEIEEDANRNQSMFPDCVVITISSQNDIVFVTLDFGSGCELPNGNVVSGQIHLTYGPVQNGTRTINYSFENFTFNLISVEGGGTIFRERNNAAGNPQSTVHKNLELTFQNGLVLNLDGTRVAEWIEGVGSGTWSDNVFLITGNRTIQASTGFNHYAIITQDLRRESSCPFFVSGIIEITRNNGNAVLNFGEGVCDNLATLTINGETHIIVLD